MSTGRQERTADVTGYHAKGTAPVVDRYWEEGCGREVLERDRILAQPTVDVEDEEDSVERFVVVILDHERIHVRDMETGRGVETHYSATPGVALESATRHAGQLNRGEIPRPTRVKEGDLVTIHTGTKRYEVIRVELDSMRSGERLDFALLEPVDDDRAPFWQACDLLHVQETRSGDTGRLQLPEVKVFKV